MNLNANPSSAPAGAPATPTDPRLAATIGWLIPFALIVYLGMNQGGFGEPVRGEVGVVVWWIVLLGLAAVELPRRRLGAAAWIGLALLAAFAGWTLLGMSWSASAGRSLTEAARALTYLGVLALALMIGGRDRTRSTIGAVGAGCAAIAAVAMLSRLHPAWFPTDDLSQLLVGVQSRLRYPVGYWNGLAGLAAIGLPLLLWGATAARSTAVRALAAAALPTIALTIYLTASRAGVAAAAIALLAFAALSERRLALLAPLGTVGAISALVVWQASRRSALIDGLGDPTAISQGNEMLLIVAVATILCGALIAALAVAEARGWTPPVPAVPRRPAAAIAAAAAAIALVGFLALGGPGATASAFDEFKQPAGVSATSGRLASAAGNGRWEYWTVAVEAAESAPLNGIGAGTYEIWWNQHRETNSVIRDAHSLFVETLGELGVVGLALIVGLIGLVLFVAAAGAWRSGGPRRSELAALFAAALAFTIGVGLDWLWEIAVIPVAFLFVAAAILMAEGDEEEEAGRATGRARQGGWPRYEVLGRVAGGALAIAAIAAIGISTIGSERLADGQADLDGGDYAGALSKAAGATDLEPYSAAARMLEARSLGAMGRYGKAVLAARAATEHEPTNWETWYLLSQLQAQRGEGGAARLALSRAKQLNPLSSLLNPKRCGASGQRCANPAAPE